ncbi:hypothetical protein Tco_1353472 [Tanacetum coccineum]
MGSKRRKETRCLKTNQQMKLFIKNFDDIKARIEADKILAEKLQEQERDSFPIEERAKMIDLITKRIRKIPKGNEIKQDLKEEVKERIKKKKNPRNRKARYKEKEKSEKRMQVKILLKMTHCH